jgi:diketogulonate reductase-like aldo/keto reductase
MDPTSAHQGGAETKGAAMKDHASAPVADFLYGTAWKEDATERCVIAALEAGFRGIDTANQRKHYHEAGVGRALESAYARGLVTRDEVFLQTKFTPRHGQDHRLPYDARASLTDQVAQSFQRSLEHLGAAMLDSYVLHGPTEPARLAPADWEVWRAMESLHEAGRTRYLGISNVNLDQLRELADGARVAPHFVQNRCFARTRWDADVRALCKDLGITYQAFSLLTANGPIARDPRFAAIVRRADKTPAQVVFRFAQQVGMLPLTGTTDPAHMREDLACAEFDLAEADLETIETIAVA